MLDEARDLVRRGMSYLDLVVVLPLNDEDRIEMPESEDPELREAMDLALLEIVENEWDGLSLGRVRIVEITGTLRQRLVALTSALAAGPV